MAKCDLLRIEDINCGAPQSRIPGIFLKRPWRLKHDGARRAKCASVAGFFSYTARGRRNKSSVRDRRWLLGEIKMPVFWPIFGARLLAQALIFIFVRDRRAQINWEESL
jgi:hypothetical protein